MIQHKKDHKLFMTSSVVCEFRSGQLCRILGGSCLLNGPVVYCVVRSHRIQAIQGAVDLPDPGHPDPEDPPVQPARDPGILAHLVKPDQFSREYYRRSIE